MYESKSLAEMTEDVVRTANQVRSRIDADGTILGWQGFHTDLDHIADLLHALRIKARAGGTVSTATAPSASLERGEGPNSLKGLRK